MTKWTEENLSNNLEKPVVSICCCAYNQEAFIRDTLQGFLMQKTDFPFEILIHDDASTDDTANIIREYASKYPNIIKPIYQSENQYSKGVKVGPVYNIARAAGKYIAMCEGDDYWTDPNKLQIQVDFLEQNPDYVISGHNAEIIDENNNLINNSIMPIATQRNFSAEEMIIGNAWLPTLTWVYRNLDFGKMPERDSVLIGDKFFTSVLGNFGKAKFHDDIKPAAYRMHKRGIWSSLAEDRQRDEEIHTYFMLYKYYRRIEKSAYAQAWYDKMSLRSVSGMSNQALLNFYSHLHNNITQSHT